ncbi:unnamed protein product [Moneuplotes crassus]|uniref:Uncharacterized protein n=1 Tax=Euplotes crassus TaxID=5936 RepID=A0AAD1UMT0_EUPCR|nr:unnamed protein product [Moneuplotes crassus]
MFNQLLRNATKDSKEPQYSMTTSWGSFQSVSKSCTTSMVTLTPIRSRLCTRCTCEDCLKTSRM